MTKKKIYVLLILGVLINTGAWLTGVYGIEVRIGSHVLGRYIGINDKETFSSLLGWFIAVGAAVTAIIILYRNR